MRETFRNVWHDPVWSKVISGAILGAVALISWQRLQSPDKWLSALVISIVVALFVVLVAGAWWYTHRKHRTLIFVSKGGTCRDPMAKAIATKLFENQELKSPLDIRAAALGPLSKTGASHAARLAIREMYGSDMLATHRPELLTERMAKDADLILVMDRSLLEPSKTAPPGWPGAYQGKVYLLKKFFGLDGDVVDPWPDGKDDETVEKYRKCAKELENLLKGNLERLREAIGI